MRRKPSGQGNYNNNNGGGGGNNNQQRKQRFQNNGGHHNQNRPRKNYAASREKYLSQARDALAAGDRVLAENYFQHAEHCYRMMVEEGYNFRNASHQSHNQQQDQAGGEQEAAPAELPRDDFNPESVTQLPAFLTGSIEDERKSEPVPPQNWEEN